jgi:hypothetical protein
LFRNTVEADIAGICSGSNKVRGGQISHLHVVFELQTSKALANLVFTSQQRRNKWAKKLPTVKVGENWSNSYLASCQAETIKLLTWIQHN